ncbi:MAG: nucleotide exchange factor GrpE [Pseudomonadales bacterium]|nr:nucleotide exchange factor GrpE [Pseudomonadales bacterium]
MKNNDKKSKKLDQNLENENISSEEGVIDQEQSCCGGHGEEGCACDKSGCNCENNQQVAELENKLAETNEKLARVLADYQNLVRRHREERAETIKFATRDFVEMLIQPYDHLRLASESLNDPGLNMIIDEFMQVLKEQQVEQLIPEGETFDVVTMEAVEKTGKGDKVTKVFSPGYILNGRVLRPARVAVG